MVECYFCKKEMNNICECGAYKVTPETYNQPLKEQPYYKEEAQRCR